MPNRYTKQELAEHFYEMLELFRDRLDTDIDKDTVSLEFFTPENGLQVYEEFCGKRFPKYMEEKCREPGYFETFAAQAFLNEGGYGVLIREDIDFKSDELHRMFLHEISHLFCTRNEIGGGELFFDKYCMGSGIEDGIINAGYAIWREAVADIIADSIISEYALISLRDSSIKTEIKRLYDSISRENPESKKAMSLIIAYVMVSRQAAGADNWDEARKAIRQTIKINDSLLTSILEQVFRQLHSRPYWKIEPEFIRTLGETYLSLAFSKSFYGMLTGKP